MTELQGWALVITAITGLVSTLVTGTLAVFTFFLTRRVKEVHDATNGLVAKLVTTTGREQHAAGMLEQKDKDAGKKGIP